jgi:hypothetical protein
LIFLVVNEPEVREVFLDHILKMTICRLPFFDVLLEGLLTLLLPGQHLLLHLSFDLACAALSLIELCLVCMVLLFFQPKKRNFHLSIHFEVCLSSILSFCYLGGSFSVKVSGIDLLIQLFDFRTFLCHLFHL